MTELPQPISLPTGFLEAICKDNADFNRRVYRRKDLAATVKHLATATQRGGFEMLAPFLIKFPRPVILEIGSGYGFGLCFLLRNGFNVKGVEPGATSGFEGRFESACTLLRHNGLDPGGRLFPATGENLPFPDNSFDLVFSIAVLEHVRDPDRVMSEALRVCRPGGYIVMNVPNYNSFIEAHYMIPWIPYLLRSKSKASAWVARVWRLDPYFVDELNFTIPGDFSKKKPWATMADQLSVHPFLFRPLLYISALAWFLSLRDYRRHPVLRWFKPHGALSWLHAPAQAIARSITMAGSAIGLAPVFNVVARKRRAMI